MSKQEEILKLLADIAKGYGRKGEKTSDPILNATRKALRSLSDSIYDALSHRKGSTRHKLALHDLRQRATVANDARRVQEIRDERGEV